jgi:hypothetical protein
MRLPKSVIIWSSTEMKKYFLPRTTLAMDRCTSHNAFPKASWNSCARSSASLGRRMDRSAFWVSRSSEPSGLDIRPNCIATEWTRRPRGNVS